MKTRIVHTKIWKDSYFYSLSRAEKLAFIYLLTNENVNLCGIYELNPAELKTWVGLTDQEIEDIKVKFTNDKKFLFTDSWVKIVNHDKYNNIYTGDKNQTAKDREISMIPDSVLKKLDSVSIHYPYTIDSPINHKSEIINHKSEIIKSEFSKLEDITQSVIQEIADKYEVPTTYVEDIKLDMEVWMGKNPTKNHYSNYRLALMTWVRKKKEETLLKVKSNNFKRGGVLDATNL